MNKPDFTRELFVFIFIIIFLLLVTAFLFYNSIKGVTVLLNEVVALYNDYEEELPLEKFLTGNTLKETFVFYIYKISDNMALSNNNIPKIILKRHNFSVKYSVKKNSIVLEIPYKDMNMYETKSFIDRKRLIEIPKFPNQKWVQLAIVINGRTVDVYIDSILVRTEMLDNVPDLKKGGLQLGQEYKNPNLFLGRIEYTNTNLSANQIRALYFRNKYNLKLTNDIKLNVKKTYLEIRDKLYSPNLS